MNKGDEQMKKEIIRREFLKLKLKDYSYIKCRDELLRIYGVKVSTRTLKRWYKRFEKGDWDLRDNSTRPNIIYYKFYAEDVEQVINLRKIKGYSSYQLKPKLEEKGIFMSESNIKKVVKNIGLSRGNKMEGMRLKWIRFERNDPNSMWQIDGTEDGKENWIIPIIDDCSRYCLAIGFYEHNTTENMIKLLEEAICMHGKPREILTDNGSEFGGNGKGDNEFDKWCDRRGIKHIRSGIHKPTTIGKISRIQFTLVSELPYCNNDLEYFRWRYNCDRPHRSLNTLTPHQVYFEYQKHKKYLLGRKEIVEGI